MKIGWFGYKGSNSWSQNHVKYARQAGYEVDLVTAIDTLLTIPPTERLAYTPCSQR